VDGEMLRGPDKADPGNQRITVNRMEINFVFRR